MPTVMTIYGTRPEAIKMAPLIEGLQRHPQLDVVVAVTGQHREMLDQVNTLFGIVPDFDLDIMTPGATLARIASRTLAAASELLLAHRPDVVVVQGDTSSAFVAALAAFYQKIPVVHLEAGLRTGDISTPFPEEANRRLTAPIAALHLAPTASARANLLAENIDAATIVVTGNTVIDALNLTLQRRSRSGAQLSDPRVAAALHTGQQVLLVTTHRRESWGPQMVEAMGAVRAIAGRFPDLRVIVPMHRNTIVRKVIEAALAAVPNVILTEPLDYREFAEVMAASEVILTDSGGVQEEGPSLGRPVLVMRETTERPEAVEAGTVVLVGTDHDTIVSSVSRLLEDGEARARMSRAVNPYGDGAAAPRCVAAIAQLLGVGHRLPDFSPGRSVERSEPQPSLDITI